MMTYSSIKCKFINDFCSVQPCVYFLIFQGIPCFYTYIPAVFLNILYYTRVCMQWGTILDKIPPNKMLNI